MKLRKTMVGVAVGVAGLLVAAPAPAWAADVVKFSTSGKSQAWYDDGSDRIVVCDHVANDGVGAHVVAMFGAPNVYPQAIAYNGCQSITNVWDDARVRMEICDWVSVNGSRQRVNCASVDFTA